MPAGSCYLCSPVPGLWGICCLVEQDLRKLGQAKVDALETLKDAVECIKKARLGDHDLQTTANITAPELEEIKALHGELIKTLGGYGAALGGGLAAGALGAIGAYGLVGTLGAASTGTAIGTLSGAAATNAALAWFGGGLTCRRRCGNRRWDRGTGRYRSRSRSNRNGSIHGDKSRKGRKGDRTENQANQS